MTWTHFAYLSLPALLLWALGAFCAWTSRRRAASLLTCLGLALFFTFIVGMWLSLERPPLRTMGETRLWYAFFLPLAGLFVYQRWQYKWILTFSTLLSAVFIGINLLKPEIHSKALMPALQSPWFAPHVIVYMFAYALLGAAAIMAIYVLYSQHRPTTDAWERKEVLTCDNLVRIGLAFLTIGMLFGALWAKEAWGHYWSWDPKETWAAITWLAYLSYLHYRRLPRRHVAVGMWTLVVAFVLLQICWWGINYLPSAQGISVHTYSS